MVLRERIENSLKASVQILAVAVTVGANAVAFAFDAQNPAPPAPSSVWQIAEVSQYGSNAGLPYKMFTFTVKEMSRLMFSLWI